MSSAEVTDAPSASIPQLALALSHGHVNQLPVELLREVFTLVVNDRQSHSWGLMFEVGTSAHGVLALVCRKWRPIIETFSRVPWQFTKIDLGNDCLTSAVSPQGKVKIANAILAFSGSRRLDVTLDLRVLNPKAAWLHFVLVHAWRFRTFTIRGDLRDMDVCKAFSRLQHDSRAKEPDVALRRLTLEHIPRADSIPRDSPNTVPLEYSVAAPSLSEICLEGPMSSYLVSPQFHRPLRVRKLVCTDFGIVALHSLLNNTGLLSLKELDWDRRPSAMPAGVPDYAESKMQDVLSLPTSPAKMRHLKKITLRNAAYALKSKFFDNVILPKVEEITLDDIDLKDNVVKAVRFGKRRRTRKITVNRL